MVACEPPITPFTFVGAAEAEAFDARFPPKEKKHHYSQDLFSGASSIPKTGIEPAAVVLTKSALFYTITGNAAAMRRMVPSITALTAANNLRMRRLRLIISA